MGRGRLRLPAQLIVTVMVSACGHDEKPCVESCVPALHDAAISDATNDAITGCPAETAYGECPPGCQLRLQGDCFT